MQASSRRLWRREAWSCCAPRSVASDWVRSEAHCAQNHGKLAPVLIESCTVPLAFMLKQAGDLSSWRGSADTPEWRQLLLEWLAAGSQVPLTPPAVSENRSLQRGKTGRIGAVVAAIAVAASLVAFFAYRAGTDQTSEPRIGSGTDAHNISSAMVLANPRCCGTEVAGPRSANNGDAAATARRDPVHRYGCAPLGPAR